MGRQPNGRGTVPRRRSGGRKGWTARIKWTNPDGTPGVKDVYGDTASDCADKLDAVRAEIAVHGKPATGGRGVTVKEYLSEWCEIVAPAKGWSEATRRKYVDAIKQHAEPFFTGPISKLKYPDVARFARSLETKAGRRAETTLSPTTRAGALIALRHALDDATRAPYHYLSVNPARFVKLPKGHGTPVTPRRALLPAELAACLSAADDAGNIGAAYRVMVLTGARCSDLANMRWSRTDLTNGTAVITKGKTRAAERTITLDETVCAVLRAHRKDQAAARLAAHSWADPDAVFTREDGTPMTAGYLSDRIKRKVPFSAHYARHTFITNAAAGGVPLEDLRRHVGHAKIAHLARYMSPTDIGAAALRDTAARLAALAEGEG